ncbi:MAG: hypothetical protein KAS49_01975 [Candidatus Cloacimonetes bacterium]|nr:hypothetical protein [Candidatus Cloacimonadota bacterium]
MKLHKILFVLILIISFYINLTAELIQLESIKLSGKDGGYADGKDWSSDFLLGKINVIIYIDPDKFSEIKQFISDLKLEKSKIKKKAKQSEAISYVLDNAKILVEK